MLSLDEAMQLDFAGVDAAGFGTFGFDDFETTSSGAGSGDGSSPVEASTRAEGDDDELRRLRRRVLNRESAQRSRARRRQRAEDLERAAGALRAERRALAARLGAAATRALAVRRDNARLLAEAGALRRRLAEAQRHAALLLALARARLALTTAASGCGGGDGAAPIVAPAPAPLLMPQQRATGGVASMVAFT